MLSIFCPEVSAGGELLSSISRLFAIPPLAGVVLESVAPVVFEVQLFSFEPFGRAENFNSGSIGKDDFLLCLVRAVAQVVAGAGTLLSLGRYMEAVT